MARVTFEDIKRLDRLGRRDTAIMALMAAEAHGRAALRMSFWPSEKRRKRLNEISEDLSLLLSTPPLAEFDEDALRADMSKPRTD